MQRGVAIGTSYRSASARTRANWLREARIPFWQNSLAMRTPAERPLSPHLQVYRPQYTMVLSILHRTSGLWLSACGFLFVGWLLAAALGPEPYACAIAFLSTFGIRIVLALGLAAFWYHLFAGLRHLAWDAGHGFEKRTARLSGRVMFVCALAAFIATLVLTPAGRFFAGAP
jgi:succinate dehydrogenase / fumarate reductase cytochrome b subunit